MIKKQDNAALQYGIQAGNIYLNMERVLTKSKFMTLKKNTVFTPQWIGFLMKIAELADQFEFFKRSTLSLNKLYSNSKYLDTALEELKVFEDSEMEVDPLESQPE
ncbi:hypothetical protein BOX15_Mlig020835g1 [Macrostomum lignano]|uniref:Uncharacterized protein n=1 Tax=Macrostomum lignano TaxID=282301 RepID=A0A267DY34_9PLAT|nr:hypothetical protein BOX15_Mlig020835g1 [Macrostomum lignano]